MKKLLVWLLAGVMLCGAAACSNGGKDNTPQAEVTAATAAQAAEEPQTNNSTAHITAANQKIKEALDALEAANYEGVVFAVQDGETIGAFANGKLYDGTAVTLETPMPVGSVSKQFCAAAIMKLQEEGKLSVSDGLDTYFPDYEQASKMTLHHLLSMRSGIPNLPETEDKAGVLINVSNTNTAEENTALFLEWVFAQPLNFEPDEGYEYSNCNYMLLANVVEKVSGKAYFDYLRETFLQPLGMTHTGSVLELKDNPAWAQGCTEKTYEIEHGSEPGLPKGAGDIISTAADMTLWMNALPSGSILSEESYAAMTTDYSSGYGYGLTTDMGNGVGHYGNIGTFAACDYIEAERNLTLMMACKGGLSTITNHFYSIYGAL